MERIVHYFRDAVVVNGYLWFLEDNMNALFRMDILNSKIEFILSFPSEQGSKRVCNALIKCGDKLVCCPRYTRYIIIYDTISGNSKSIGVETDNCKYCTENMFGKLAVGNMVYLQRDGHSSIYQLNVLSGEIGILDIIGKKIESKSDEIFWHWKMRQYKSDTQIILYNVKQNILYQYNIATLKAEELIRFDEEHRIVDFETDGFVIWLLCCDGMIFKLDGNQVMASYKSNIYETNDLELLYYNNRVYIINVMLGKIVQVLDSDAYSDMDFLKLTANNTGVYSSYFGAENCFWIQWNDGFFYYNDKVKKISGIFDINLTDIPLDAYSANGILFENRGSLIINILKAKNKQLDVMVNASENRTGGIIYNTILKDLW